MLNHGGGLFMQCRGSAKVQGTTETVNREPEILTGTGY